ncbi:sensor histidine kinase [Variovorax sp. RHLX14]|uniref:sensor histidine kinase n=1 Tax=Variovorax sp. RHLX14 TaxID=1259731 RepID=UPI003F46EB3F
MQIADFLDSASDKILEESVAYARTIRILKDEEESVLRDHLPLVLHAISADLRSAQSRTESIDKSHGKASAAENAKATAAETHGLMRARSGLDIDQVVAEYRALRACVVRLWADAAPATSDSLRDVGRFNEAVDQALAESVRVYAEEVDHWQQIFLGVLGHDLRTPLNAIALTAELIAAQASGELARATSILKRSTRRIASLMDSLLDYNCANLNGGMLIKRSPTDLRTACVEEIELQRAALPDAKFDLKTVGDTSGEFDASRVREALGNLISNAVKHGTHGEMVTIRIEEAPGVVRLAVDNAANQNIPEGEIEQLFEPLRRGALDRSASERSNLGLGLFIVRQIVNAHGGEVIGHSASNRVTFTITLPKAGPANPGRD